MQFFTDRFTYIQNLNSDKHNSKLRTKKIPLELQNKCKTISLIFAWEKNLSRSVFIGQMAST